VVVSAFRMDTTGWPMIHLEVGAGFDRAELRALLARFDAVHERDEPFVILIDLSNLKVNPGASMRRCAVDWMREHKAQGERLNRGTAIVFESVVIRQALTAIFWVWKPPVPLGTFRDGAAARAFLTKKAAEAGITLPPA